jgi:hypothetical protein
LNNVHFNPENTNMQTLFVEKLALTFAGDAYALVTGFGEVVVKIVTAPVERIATACDVAGVLSRRRAKANLQSRSPRRCLSPFRSLNHLT